MSPSAPRRAPTEVPAPGSEGALSKGVPAKWVPAKRAPAKRAPVTKGSAPEMASRVVRHERLGSPRTGVLISGGASGIGRETALALAEVGRPVAIWDVDAGGAEDAATLCRERYGVASHWSVVDVAETSALEAAVPEAEAALGSLGGFVHSAGVSGAMLVDDIDDEVWDATLDVNLRAGVMICRLLIEPFRRAGPGSSVVFVSSIEGLFGSVFLPAYCASKAGVLGVMRSIAHRFASDGFRVNAVCPGAVATPLLAPAFELPGFRQQVEERTPLRRVSTPDEIARPIRFLLSDEASFITGTHLTIDGGMTSITAI
jgi:NAD(P)-dependent dehydrogenase (short-subunit alcohol dehydrogenase family)